jgi:hypothetical protein
MHKKLFLYALTIQKKHKKISVDDGTALHDEQDALDDLIEELGVYSNAVDVAFDEEELSNSDGEEDQQSHDDEEDEQAHHEHEQPHDEDDDQAHQAEA